jgi:hypothetical protein
VFHFRNGSFSTDSAGFACRPTSASPRKRTGGWIGDILRLAIVPWRRCHWHHHMTLFVDDVSIAEARRREGWKRDDRHFRPHAHYPRHVWRPSSASRCCSPFTVQHRPPGPAVDIDGPLASVSGRGIGWQRKGEGYPIEYQREFAPKDHFTPRRRRGLRPLASHASPTLRLLSAYTRWMAEACRSTMTATGG